MGGCGNKGRADALVLNARLRLQSIICNYFVAQLEVYIKYVKMQSECGGKSIVEAIELRYNKF